ncbi:TPA: MoaD/ThiS family protein [Candidatus Poribacteria bacterium]|nr:MoaD/ThiS family protein [Candidatus Poribacteria bacterium]
MRLKFYAVFRDITGQKELDKEFSGTLGQLLDELCDEFGQRMRRYIFDEEGRVRKYVKIFVNGRNIQDLEGLETRLDDEDEVAIFPPIAGG